MVSESPARPANGFGEGHRETNSPMTIPITSRVVKDFIGPFFIDSTRTTAPNFESCITVSLVDPWHI